MKQILLFGAGKSATVLISYLANAVQKEGWHLTVADANLELVQQKLKGAPNTTAVSVDIADADARKKQIAQADIVISLLPPKLHILVAKDCIVCKKNLLTGSYVHEEMKKLETAVDEAGLLFLCEMGLDPGIDHMSAKQLIDAIHDSGGKITSFFSHCGGLVAPESDDNPWHYKISWSPRNVVLAGKAGAVYKEHGVLKKLDYKDLFSGKRYAQIAGLEPLCWYPNRDSISYLELYGLHDCETFIRTTLRHPDFIMGWKNIIDLQLTDETVQYNATGKSLKELFKEHLDKYHFEDWLAQKLRESFDNTQTLLTGLLNLSSLEQTAEEKGMEPIDEFMLVDEGGDLKELAIDDLKRNAATALAGSMHDANLTLKQLLFLGLNDETKMPNEACSAADILQFALEKNLALGEDAKDMVVMQHEIEFEQNQQRYKHTSTLIVKGENNRQTAMAKTVGLPLGIAATLILKGVINCKGLHIPVSKEIYEPVLAELAQNGILFLNVNEPVQ